MAKWHKRRGGERNVVIAQNTCTSACVLKTSPLSISIGDNGSLTPSFSANSKCRPLELCLLTFVPNCEHPIQFGGLLNELPLPQPSSPILFWLSSPIHYYSLFISCELKAWTMVASHGCCFQCFLWLENMVFLMGWLEIIASLVMEWHRQ